MIELFNASTYLLDRRIDDGDGDRIALAGVAGETTYAELHDRVLRTAGGLRRAGLRPEQRLLMVMADSPEFVTVFLAAMRIGAIPVPVSTMVRTDGLVELLRDSRARFLAATAEFSTLAGDAANDAPELDRLLGPGDVDRLAAGEPDDTVYPTTADSPAFWLYTSGTTGRPKAAMHRHGSVPVVCETYGRQVLGIRPDDRCLSAAKAFFAYGLGNSVLFPMSVGATAVLEPAPSKPDTIAACARTYGATLFFGGPTFFATMLRTGLPADALPEARLATSAGEALPAELYRRWTSYFGVDIIDGAPDADGLDKPVAYVVLRPGCDVTEDGLVDHCREGIESFKRPRRVVFVDGYPTTATGKVRRVELRDAARQLLRDDPTRTLGVA